MLYLIFLWILFQSTLSVRRATWKPLTRLPLIFAISIHALREESDFKIKAKYDRATGISIHALREESDLRTNLMPTDTVNFNPRSP